MRHSRWGVAAIGLGVTLLVGSVGFRAAAAPALVRFPLNVDVTARYSGTATTYVDQKTLLPLAHPKSEPLQISRHVKAVSGTFSKAVVDETVTVKTPSLRTVETYQYVIDRRTMQMVSDPRQIAFGDPKAVMHAAPGSYRVNFSMGTKANGSYLAFIPEADVTSHLVLVRGLHSHPGVNLPVMDFVSNVTKPVAPYYLKHLQAMGLPMQITGAQLEPQLIAAGIDVNQALADVGPHLTAAGKKLISKVLATPVKLNYFFIDNGTVSIEPKTGALIDVHAQRQGISVQPDLSGIGILAPLLNEYISIPSVKALSVGLSKLAMRPAQIAESYTYTETVPSSLAAAHDARTNQHMMTLVERQIPWAMALLGALLLAAGLVVVRRSRRRGPGVEGPTEATPEPVAIPPLPPEPVPVGVGSNRTHEGV